MQAAASGGSYPADQGRHDRNHEERHIERESRAPRGRSGTPPGRRWGEERKNPGPPPAVVHLANLTRTITAAHVTDIAGYFGKVVSAEVPLDATTGLSRGFAHITMACAADAAAVVAGMTGGNVDGNAVKPSLLLVPQQSTARRGRSRSRSPPPRDDWRRRERSPPRGRGRSPPPYRGRGRSPPPHFRGPPRGGDRRWSEDRGRGGPPGGRGGRQVPRWAEERR